jgi:hypothetical protein
MYYLNSKVIIGYVGNNLEEDMRIVPVIVVFRKEWGNLHRKLFLDFLGRRRYQRVSFPVLTTSKQHTNCFCARTGHQSDVVWMKE